MDSTRTLKGEGELNNPAAAGVLCESPQPLEEKDWVMGEILDLHYRKARRQGYHSGWVMGEIAPPHLKIDGFCSPSARTNCHWTCFEYTDAVLTHPL